MLSAIAAWVFRVVPLLQLKTLTDVLFVEHRLQPIVVVQYTPLTATGCLVATGSWTMVHCAAPVANSFLRISGLSDISGATPAVQLQLLRLAPGQHLNLSSGALR